MAWPSLADYNAAFATPERGLPGASLKGATAKFGPMGGPMPISGGLALIYELTLPDGRHLAVRCFQSEDVQRMQGTAEACALLSSTLASTPSLRPYFARAEWVADCVVTAVRSVPAIVMDWLPGRVLSAWLEARHRNTADLMAFRERVAGLAATLEEGGVVHGDLQARNIFVTDGERPVLIDFDELRFAGRSAAPTFEAGHPHFQHPAWGSSCDAARKDRFPLIALDIGLAAMAADHSLFDRFATGENVLFVRDDFLDPDSSPAFAALRTLDGFSRAAELFAGLCRADPGIVPSLAEFRAEAGIPTQASGTASMPARASVAEATTGAQGAAVRVRSFDYVGPYPVFAGQDFRGILGAVGRSVEVVGRILSVKDDGVTKHGDPYVFVNFADWRGNGFKLTIWSEGLGSFSSPPNRSWEGRWVSATGLVDEPYLSRRWDNSQLSITVLDSSQLRFIDEAEARYRLGLVTSGPVPSAAARPASSGPKRPSNAELLATLPASPPASTSPHRATATGGGVVQRPSLPLPRPPDPPPEHRGISTGAKVFLFAAVAFVLYLLIKSLGR